MSRNYDNFADLITFSRASQSTVVDSDGTLKYAAHNLVTYSEFDSATPTNWTANFDTGTGSRTLGSSLYNLPTLTFEQTVAGRRHIAQNLTFEANTAYKLVVFIDEAESFFTSGNQTVFAVTGLSDSTGTKNVRIQDSVSGVLTCSFTTGSDTSGFVQIGIGCFADTVGKLVCAGVHLYKADKPMQNNPAQSDANLATYVPTTSAAVYQPRIDFDAVTGDRKGLLIEEARTNLFTYSEDFTQWTPSFNISITSNTTTSPDGTLTADTANKTAGTFQFVSQSVTVVDATDYTFFIYLKAGTATTARLRIISGTTDENLLGVNTSTGVVSSGVNGVDVGNGWYRYTLSFTSDGTTATVYLYPANTTSDTGSTFVWGAQLEQGSFPTSYIPTSGATATRSADVASIATSAFGYNSTEGTLFTEDQAIHDTGGTINYAVCSLFEDNDNYVHMHYRFASGRVQIETEGTSVIVASGDGDLGSPNKRALGFDTSSAIHAYNGILATDTSTGLPSPLSTMTIGSFGNSSFPNYFNGHIKKLQYFPRRLSDTELQEITS